MNKWICDTCGQPIEKAEDGWVEWISYVGDKQGRDLRLVHAFAASPRTDNAKCQFNERYEYSKDSGMVSDNSLSEFVGPDGLMRLLVFISENELPTTDALEMIKRLHIPGYEATRKHFDRAIHAGVFEPNMPKDFYNQCDIEATLKFLKSN